MPFCHYPTGLKSWIKILFSWFMKFFNLVNHKVLKFPTTAGCGLFELLDPLASIKQSGYPGLSLGVQIEIQPSANAGRLSAIMQLVSCSQAILLDNICISKSWCEIQHFLADQVENLMNQGDKIFNIDNPEPNLPHSVPHEKVSTNHKMSKRKYVQHDVVVTKITFW